MKLYTEFNKKSLIISKFNIESWNKKEYIQKVVKTNKKKTTIKRIWIKLHRKKKKMEDEKEKDGGDEKIKGGWKWK